MKTHTIVSVCGIRPDFIRMSEVFRRLDESPKINHVMIHTGQHYDELLSDVFFRQLEIRKPDYNLGIGGRDNQHQHQLANLSVGIIDLFRRWDIRPDLVLFLGDSNSALAGIPLKKEGYRIGHIEAGMRTFDQRLPEEVNRVCLDSISDILFAYHQLNADNLSWEGNQGDVHVVGNTIVEVCRKVFSSSSRTQDFILVDIHRHENIVSRTRLGNIIEFLKRLIVDVDLPVCMVGFPRTMRKIEEEGLPLGDIEVVPLMSYSEFLASQYNCRFMVSDSGTAQEEPAMFGTPVLVPRRSTERPQSVKGNCSRMVNVDTLVPPNQIESLSDFALNPGPMDVSWLGDGKTSQRIVSILERWL